MGSGTSKMGSKQSRPLLKRSFHRCNSKLSSFLCGGSSSRATLEMEDGPDEILITSARHCDPVFWDVRNHAKESFFSGTETGSTSSSAEIGSPSDRSVAANDGSGMDGIKSFDAKCSSESNELVPPSRVSSAYDLGDSGRHSIRNEVSTSFKEQFSDHVSVNDLANKDAVNVHDDSASEGVSYFHPETTQPSSSSPYGLGNSDSGGMHVENSAGEMTMGYSDSRSAPNRSDAPYSLRDESTQEAVPSSLGFPLFDMEPGREDEGVLHVDVVSISSSIFNNDTSSREARRNSRRLFWDAFSRRGSSRHMDSSAFLLSTDDADDLGSHNRWLLDFSGDIFDDGVDSDSGNLGSRIHRFNERRRHSRSEIWERLHSGLSENGRQTTRCPSGLHTEGTCSCESFLTSEGASARASISRIVMLAEALFEVLDEIHRQPLSLALSMISLPAPESVVDSFPLKNHKKVGKVEDSDDVEQCYICLCEYEEGDKIRVLPCHHEYHMTCVDKWLKEIHGVCPLCRGDVRQGANESSVPNSEVASV